MYKAAAAAAPAEGAASEGAQTHEHTDAKKDEGVIDAEYVDVDK